LGQFLRITEAAKILGLLLCMYLFFRCVQFDKYGLGYIFGDFFIKSSGHPAIDRQETIAEVDRQTLYLLAAVHTSITHTYNVITIIEVGGHYCEM
jgi:hypothetical protein